MSIPRVLWPFDNALLRRGEVDMAMLKSGRQGGTQPF